MRMIISLGLDITLDIQISFKSNNYFLNKFQKLETLETWKISQKIKLNILV